MPVCPQSSCLLPAVNDGEPRSNDVNNNPVRPGTFPPPPPPPPPPLPNSSKLNNIVVGGGVAGILQKWVNYGKGWRPRWFVLHDGVLSYYKIHGPHKISISKETEKGVRVIGEDSLKLIRKPKNQGVEPNRRRRPLGEVHLKVSSIRESRSDDKRFSIFSGTKRLHLRAESREDRAAWIEALQVAKDLFPHISINDLTSPVENITVSTEKLRSRLLEEGLSEEAIQESEQIMMAEFSTLQNQLNLLQRKQFLLIETLRQLETEKFDLETKVVDESQHHSKQASSSKNRNGKYSEGSVTDSDDDNERQDGPEEESDEDEYTYFDTREFLSSNSLRRTDSGHRRSSVDSDDGLALLNSRNGVDVDMQMVGFNYPYAQRRKSLPEPKEKEKGVSL